MGETSPPKQTHVTVLLPTLNEEEGLAKTLADIPFEALRSRGFDVDVLVVDGRSVDRTREVALAHHAVVLDQVGRGKGGAVREGLEWAARHGSEFVITLDADFTYAAETILPLLSLLSSGSDLVIGVRRPEGSILPTARSVIHRVGDVLLNAVAARLSRVPFLDICSGLWGVRTSAVPALALESSGFEIEAEMFLKMARMGFLVSQVPVVYRARVGEAKLHAVSDGSRILLSILRFGQKAPFARDRFTIPLQLTRQISTSPNSPASGQLLRALLAVCFSLGPPKLTISAHRDRLPQAEELARQLRAGHLVVDVVVDSEPGAGIPDLARVAVQPATAPSAERPSHPNPVVRLPRLIRGSISQAMAIVGIPQSDRIVYLSSEQRPRRVGPIFSRSGAYRLESTGMGGVSALSLLTQPLNSSEHSGELALLSANAHGLGLEVFRRTGPAPSSSAAPRANTASGPVGP